MAQPVPQPAASPVRAHLMAPALLLVAVALCYLPALAATFGYADDYVQLSESISKIKWLQQAWNEAARPIGGWLTEWSFHAVGTIAGLAYLRAAALLLLLLLALAIYRHLLTWTHEPALAALAAAFVCTQTPFQVNVGWGAMWLYLIPPLLSYAAYHAILRGEQGAYRARALWLLLALALLYIALNIYPPSTMFLWFWFGTEAVLADIAALRLLRRFLLFLVMCGAACVLYYGIYKAFGYHHARGELTPEIATKLAWFIRLIVVMRASRLQWYECVSRWLPLSVWLLIVLGIFLLRKSSVLSRAVKLGICAALVFLCYLPLLIVKEYDAPFRSQTVLTSYIGALAFLGVWGILERLHAPSRIRYVALCALVAAGLVKANATLVRHEVLSQSLDYRFLRAALSIGLAAHPRVVLRTGTPDLNCWDELCRVTSHLGTQYPMLSSMAVLIARESWDRKGVDPAYRLRVVPHGTQLPPPEDTAIIDMQPVTDMLRSR